MSVRNFLPLLSLVCLPAFAGNGWSEVARPTEGPARVIGGYTNGCIAGAVALPLLGEGYQVMRPSRHRNFGHPQLVSLLQNLGKLAADEGKRMLVGDLGQPRGGPLISGHRSHQSGLDVDVWFLMEKAGRTLSRGETESLGAPSMVKAADGELIESRWAPEYRDLLKAAAEAPEVERIFVNPIIKQALCRTESERGWLNKIRPWWNHEEHFHARLYCPPGASDCAAQKPVPPGDGCDADLDNWVRDVRQAARSTKHYAKPKPPSVEKLPAECAAVLAGD